MDVRVSGSADEDLLLDLLNTTPVLDGVARDDLQDPKAARAWMTQRGLVGGDDELAGLVAARAALQAVVRGEASPSVLRGFVDGVSLRPVATADGLDWEIFGPVTGAVRAVLAWDALRITSPGRLRPCANTECRLFLIDRSKPNTARWCSMAICGNRMKARRHYRRTHGAESGV
jgi:CGNR zinc finger/Putative stress-induced transcription regulator